MPPLDIKTESRPACAAEWPGCSGEIERAQTSHRAARVGSVGALAISNRQFLARLEIAVTSSKQRADYDSNRHFWTGLSYNVAARSDLFNSLAAKMEIKESPGGVSFDVRVTPRASRNTVEGEHGGALKVRLTAPPVEGRANQALRRHLAERLDVPLSAVRIVAGEKSRTKRVTISGVTREQVLALIQPQRPQGKKEKIKDQ